MTNIMGKQVINVMACGPLPLFLEHIKFELRRETAANLREKILDVKLRLLSSIRMPIEGYSINNADVAEMEDGEHGAEPLPRATKTEHFKNPPMFTFVSDNPNVMRSLRRLLLEEYQFMFVFGCTPHALHKFCEDVWTLAGPNCIHGCRDQTDSPAACGLRQAVRAKVRQAAPC